MTGNQSISTEIGNNSPTQNNTTVTNNEAPYVAESIMESFTENNPAEDPKSTTKVQNKGKKTEFEDSYNDAEKMTNNDYDRRIEHGSEIVFSNNRYTTPVSFEFASEKNSQYLNVFASHKKVFVAMKIADTSTKIISNDGTVFDSSSDFPEGQEHFPTINRLQLRRTVFVSCKIESSLRLSQFKFGERTIIAALIKHNIFINYDKYKTHKEDSIGWFKYISPTVALQKTTRIRLEEALMAVYMTEEETKALTKTGEKESDEAVVIPAFDIHCKNVGNGNGAGRITTNAYESRCHPDNSNIFKALLARCSGDINNAFHFIPFGLP